LQLFDEMIDKDMMSSDKDVDDIEDIIRDVVQAQIYLITIGGNSTHTWVTSSLGFNGESTLLELLKYLTIEHPKG